jgi:mannose-6-phosphate isomerase
MQPAFDPRPWGTLDLSPIYPNHRFEEKIGEAWLTGDACKVATGPLSGQSLSELSSQYGRELVGDVPADPNRFPLLLKFLFPHEKLSVQVHPDDEAARRVGQPWGKTECWYVAHATPEAEIGLGLTAGTTRAQFEKAIHENRAEELLNWVKVAAGDLIYVAGGTVHTLGPGAIIIETQQQSDTTFRLYDYGRPRELHLKDGLRVIKDQVASGKVKPRAFAKSGMNGNRVLPLVESPYFSVERLELHGGQKFDFAAEGKSSAQILVAIEGWATLTATGCESVRFGKGEAVVVPASIPQFKVQPEGEVQFLRSYVPGKPLPPPEVI